jgi:ketosteroid isomerase-like protein
MTHQTAKCSLEIVTEIYEAYEADDTDAVVERLAPDAVATTSDGQFDGATAIAENLMDLPDGDGLGFGLDRLVGGGDVIVAFATLDTSGEDGQRRRQRIAHRWHLSGGEVTEVETFTHRPRRETPPAQ